MEQDGGETFHITKHILRTESDVKTLDVKILELKEDPSNLQLLVDVMAMIYSHLEFLQDEPLRDFDLVNYVLAAALKSDKLEAQHLGLVMSYLDSIDAPDLYFQYAILRVSQKLDELKLYDIATALTFSHKLGEEDTMAKLERKIQEYVIHASDKELLGTGTNLLGLCFMYSYMQAN